MIWRWPHFTRAEMRCADGSERIDPEFMDRLEGLRVAYDRPMIVTSAYRSPGYNDRVSSTGRTGPHTTGRAIDIAVRGGDALQLVCLARQHGFTGIGVAQKGGSRFIHLDDLPNGPGCPRPWIWSY